MRFRHPLHPGRDLWLGYCWNLAAPEELEDLLGDLAALVVPLRDRLTLRDGSGRAAPFGVGLYLPARLARTLAGDDGACDELAAYLAEERLVPFTLNAFPYGGFQRDGVKREVFRPTWADEARLQYTLDVARVAARLLAAQGGLGDGHLSISTHPGAFGSWLSDRSLLRRCAEGIGRAVGALAALEAEGAPRTILALEAEPRASSGTTRALAEFLVFTNEVAARVLRTERGHDPGTAARLVERHLGVCLDACHAAVEFEEPAEALRLARLGGPLGKLQVSNALALPLPGTHPDAVAALLALDEPRFLHQTTARLGDELLRVDDLDELRERLAGPEAPRWLAADEWRCHFHVPIDRERLAARYGGGDGTTALGTTRATADALVRLVAQDLGGAAPALHIELETYTWSVLPGERLNGEALVEGLAGEYRHVLGLLEREGWDREGSRLERPTTGPL